MKKIDYLILFIMMIGIIGFYHLTMQARFYDVRGIQVPEKCEEIAQVILYPGRESIAIVCELEEQK